MAVARENVRLLNLSQLDRHDLSNNQPISSSFPQQNNQLAPITLPATPGVKPDQPFYGENRDGNVTPAWQLAEELGGDVVAEIAHRLFENKAEMTATDWENLCAQEPQLIGWLELFSLIF